MTLRAELGDSIDQQNWAFKSYMPGLYSADRRIASTNEDESS